MNVFGRNAAPTLSAAALVGAPYPARLPLMAVGWAAISGGADTSTARIFALYSAVANPYTPLAGTQLRLSDVPPRRETRPGTR